MKQRWICWALIALCVCIVNLASAGEASPGRAAGAATENDQILETFSVAKNGDGLLLPVVIGDKTYPFVVDTGCTCSGVDSSLVVGKPKASRDLLTPAGTVSLQIFDPPNARVGGFRLRDTVSEVVGVDMSGLREASGVDFFGMLGMDFLSQHVIRIDFDKGELSFLKTADHVSGTPQWMLPNEFNVPTVLGWVSVNRGPERFILDTGAWGAHTTGAIGKPLLNDLVKRENYRQLGTGLSETVAGTGHGRIVQGARLHFGEFVMDDPVFGEAETTHLGLWCLSRFNVTLDFPRRLIYLRERKASTRAEKIDATEARLYRKGGKVLLSFVGDASRAKRAGLKAGDEILKVAGLETIDASLDKLQNAISVNDAPVHVIASRMGSRIEAAMHVDASAADPKSR